MNRFLENVRECDFDRRISEVVEMLEVKTAPKWCPRKEMEHYGKE